MKQRFTRNLVLNGRFLRQVNQSQPGAHMVREAGAVAFGDGTSHRVGRAIRRPREGGELGAQRAAVEPADEDRIVRRVVVRRPDQRVWLPFAASEIAGCYGYLGCCVEPLGPCLKTAWDELADLESARGGRPCP